MTQLLGVRIRNETDRALREYAQKREMRLGEAADQLLERALLAPIDEASEQLIMPHMRRMLADVLAREMRAYIKHVFDELTHNYEQTTAAIVRGQLHPQVDRLAGLVVLSGKEAAAARRIASNIAIETTEVSTSELERDADEYAGQRVARWRTQEVRSNGSAP